MQIPLHQWFISDAALALVIFAATALFVLWSMPFAGWRETLGLLRGLRSSPTSGQFSLETAAATFQQFQALSMYEVTRMRAAYARLGRAHKRMGYDLGYPRKLDRLEDATRTNAAVAERIAHMAKEELGTEASSAPSVPSGSLNRAREAFRHFIRDWSEEGAPERTRIFEPILKVLDKVPINEREKMRVLVPGCGLGRLAWEVSELGAHSFCHTRTVELNCHSRIYHYCERTVPLYDYIITIPSLPLKHACHQSSHYLSLRPLVLAPTEYLQPVPLRFIPGCPSSPLKDL